MNRKNFLKSTLVSPLALLTSTKASGFKFQDKPSPIELSLVKEFVQVAHGNLPRVKELLENNHLLLHVSHDWGGGDFESAIEAAGHVGNKEIANYLLSKGARYNVFLAAMFGHTDVVKKALSLNPLLLSAKGPHGFTLLHHAQKGGADASATVDYLVSLGAKETKIDFYSRL